MHKAIRSQADDLGDFYSQVAGTDTVGWVDMARQEFKADADITSMLARFGVMTPQRPLQFGEVDFSIDLQQAISAVTEAKRVWERMPPEIKADFPTWQTLLNAANSGELKLRFEEEPPDETTPPGDIRPEPGA